jgi:hypothetical protein
MCRSIKQLRGPGGPARAEDIHAAALQFVRKVSGFRQPAKRNAAAFETAVAEVTASVEKLLAEVARPPQ